VKGQTAAADLADTQRDVVDGAEGGTADQQDGKSEKLCEIGPGQFGCIGDQQAARPLDQERIARRGQFLGALENLLGGDGQARLGGCGLGGRRDGKGVEADPVRGDGGLRGVVKAEGVERLGFRSGLRGFEGDGVKTPVASAAEKGASDLGLPNARIGAGDE
jgi:hypothetical protein